MQTYPCVFLCSYLLLATSSGSLKLDYCSCSTLRCYAHSPSLYSKYRPAYTMVVFQYIFDGTIPTSLCDHIMFFVPYWMDWTLLNIVHHFLVVGSIPWTSSALESGMAVTAVATLGPLRKNLHDSH
ncbi:hypothetical protein OG21DRAFT_151279 [Imleria badia]|nr:hypothetical protein OG21DRAFT_151279 [Imleria badia]